MQSDSVSIFASEIQQGTIRDDIMTLSSNLIIRVSELFKRDLLSLILDQKVLHIKREMLHNNMDKLGLFIRDHFLQSFQLLLNDAFLAMGFTHEYKFLCSEIRCHTMLGDP